MIRVAADATEVHPTSRPPQSTVEPSTGRSWRHRPDGTPRAERVDSQDLASRWIDGHTRDLGGGALLRARNVDTSDGVAAEDAAGVYTNLDADRCDG